MSSPRGAARSPAYARSTVDGATSRRVLGGVIVGFAALILPLDGQRAAAQEWTATRHVRAGAMEGPGSLGSVFKVGMGRNGEILALQPSVPAISVFDSTGRFLRDVGRAGGGPGEFGILGALGWTGDTLWVMDVGQRRLHLFDRTLTFARTITPIIADFPLAGARVLPGPLLADGSILAIPVTPGPDDAHPLVLLAEDGSVQRVLPSIASSGGTITVTGSEGPIGEITNPWSDSPLWTTAADGRSIIIVHRPVADSEDEGRLRIIRMGLDGDTLVDRAFTYRPRPLGEADRDRTYRETAERIARNARVSSARQAESDLRASLRAPRYYPAVTDLVAGSDGTIWLRRERPVAGREEWQVFSDYGEMRGRVHLPEELRVHGADRQRVWGVTVNELDVPFVEVYRVSRGGVR